MFISKSIDLLVGRTPAPLNHPVCRGISIANDPFVLVVSRQHPLAFRIASTWQELDGNQWVVPTTTSPVYNALESLLQKHGITFPNGCNESMSLIANIGLISWTTLIGLLPKTLAIRYVSEGSLAIVPLDMSTILERVHVLWHAENQNPTVPLMRECLEYCGRVYGSSSFV